MSNEDLRCKECGHSLKEHQPDSTLQTGKPMSKCNECDCTEFIY